MAFRIRRTDLYGRLGTIEIGGKRVETPAYLPVIHPVHQMIPPEEIRGMGFDIAITNSYIAYKHYGDRIEELGDIHDVLGFDGVLMTDSGGYQVLEYGGIDVDPRTIAEYQIAMGTDIAVVLDEPTGVKASRSRAKETVERTLRAARETLEYVEETRGRIMWAIPIQGGMHKDLVEYSARESSKLPYDIFCIGSPVELMNYYGYRSLAVLLSTAKGALPPEKPVQLFGAGHPLTMGLAVALGADIFDSASYMLFAREGRYMTPCGVKHLKELDELPCRCPVCSKMTARELQELPREELTMMLARHNLHVLREELLVVRTAVREGRLWEYLMQKTMCHPALHPIRHLLRDEADSMRGNMELFKRKALLLFSKDDVYRPELRESRARIRDGFKPRSSSVTLVLVHDVGDPSKIRRLAGKLEGDFYIVQPFIGLTPLGLSDTYPFSQNVKPSLDVLDVVLESTAEEVARTLEGWHVDDVTILYPNNMKGFAKVIVEKVKGFAKVIVGSLQD